MICIEVSFGIVKFRFLTNINYRFSKPFRVPCFPIGTRIVVREIDNYKRGISNLISHNIINNT